MANTPLGPMTIEKDDLFFVLVRLFQLLRDVSLPTDEDDPAFTPDLELGDEEGDDGADSDTESDIVSTTPFGDFLDEHDYIVAELGNAYGDQFADLFAILATPLLADPKLRDEFIRFAIERYGETIVFTTPPPPKAKLTLVPSPPQPSSPREPDLPPETPTS